MSNLAASLLEFGAEPSSWRHFDEDGPGLLPYATLLTARRNGDAALRSVAGVYEWQGAPLMFLVDAEAHQDDRQLNPIRRLLAMRGDAPYLGVIAPGRLQVYRVALDKKSLRQTQVGWEEGQYARSMVFTRLGNERPQAVITRGWISNVVLRLLSGSTTRLIGLGASHEDAISFVGRALFTRFLADRGLLPDGMSEAPSAAYLFDTREVAKRTSKWLDQTFNGDLLPLTRGAFERLPDEGYGVLGDVLRRAKDGQLFLGWEEKWDNLHFEHIPVGVLSQAYELYLREHAPDKQRREGGYFTPKPIAELMVRASFEALGRKNAVRSARVLDPAVGGGIFLLSAFRELVAERWRADGKRPDTGVLRQILYEQMDGFDTNEAALRFSALGLYLMCIELDPDPRPVDKLGFEILRGRVLHRVKSPEEKEGKALGSLGPLVGNEHRGRYDLVIGNPPWASGTKLPRWNLVRRMVARIAKGRGIAHNEPSLPNEALDLPFVWRAMEWAKPGGQIAFALHARLLFQQGDGMPNARQALFEALDVTSIVNGAELRQTKVWPQISAPFCILFATNRTPGVEAGFRFVSPRIEKSLNSAGSMRIDAISAEVVSSRQLVEIPEILKILFRGSKADLGILERIRAEGHPTLEGFWRDKIGVADGNRLLGSGSGYQTLKASSRIRKGGDGLPGADASYLHGRPEIQSASLTSILIDMSSLNVFSHERIHDPRSAGIFSGPQTIVHQSLSAAAGRIGVAVSDEGTVFNETFYGYCPVSHPESKVLVRYLALVLGSKLAVWFALMTSGKFGFERDVVEKAALDRIPLPDFDSLDEPRRRNVETLFEGLQSGEVGWDEVDEWVSDLYGLGKRDLQVIVDTLEFNLPFAKNKHGAQVEPNARECKWFCQVLNDELLPWCERFGSGLTVTLLPLPVMLPWRVISLRTKNGDWEEQVKKFELGELARIAKEEAGSEIIVEGVPNEILIARLAQRRYWSETEARLLARRILWTQLSFLKRHANA